MTPVNLPDGQQIQIEDFPTLAAREALANAVIHRDYHLREPVNVIHSPDLLVVTSPGPLVSGVTPDNILTHPSKPRNPCLMTAARILGLAEEVGRGVDRMYRSRQGATSRVSSRSTTTSASASPAGARTPRSPDSSRSCLSRNATTPTRCWSCSSYAR